jgi:hypothetical protein
MMVAWDFLLFFKVVAWDFVMISIISSSIVLCIVSSVIATPALVKFSTNIIDVGKEYAGVCELTMPTQHNLAYPFSLRCFHANGTTGEVCMKSTIHSVEYQPEVDGTFDCPSFKLLYPALNEAFVAKDHVKTIYVKDESLYRIDRDGGDISSNPLISSRVWNMFFGASTRSFFQEIEESHGFKALRVYKSILLT